MRPLAGTLLFVCLVPAHPSAQHSCADQHWIVVTAVYEGVLSVETDPFGLDFEVLPADHLEPNLPDGSLTGLGRRAVRSCEIGAFTQWGAGARIQVQQTERTFTILFVRESVDEICAALNCDVVRPTP